MIEISEIHRTIEHRVMINEHKPAWESRPVFE